MVDENDLKPITATVIVTVEQCSVAALVCLTNLRTLMSDSIANSSLTVFISYSRCDNAIADEIVVILEEAGFTVTIDRRDLPYGEEWQNELADFIRQSDTVIWLVSPDSVKSDWCNWEIGLVTALNKRLIPIRVRETSIAEIPKAIGKIHVLPVTGVFDRQDHVEPLIRALETDYDWIKDSTRLADRAHQWLLKDRNPGFLLSGGALSDAERWKSQHPPQAPEPAPEVLDLILESRQAATRSGRWWIGGSLAVTIGAIALAGYALLNANEANSQREIVLKRESELAIQSTRLLTENIREAHSSTDHPAAARSLLRYIDLISKEPLVHMPDTKQLQNNVKRQALYMSSKLTTITEASADQTKNEVFSWNGSTFINFHGTTYRMVPWVAKWFFRDHAGQAIILASANGQLAFASLKSNKVLIGKESSFEGICVVGFDTEKSQVYLGAFGTEGYTAGDSYHQSETISLPKLDVISSNRFYDIQDPEAVQRTCQLPEGLEEVRGIVEQINFPSPQTNRDNYLRPEEMESRPTIATTVSKWDWRKFVRHWNSSETVETARSNAIPEVRSLELVPVGYGHYGVFGANWAKNQTQLSCIPTGSKLECLTWWSKVELPLENQDVLIADQAGSTALIIDYGSPLGNAQAFVKPNVNSAFISADIIGAPLGNVNDADVSADGSRLVLSPVVGNSAHLFLLSKDHRQFEKFGTIAPSKGRTILTSRLVGNHALLLVERDSRRETTTARVVSTETQSTLWSLDLRDLNIQPGLSSQVAVSNRYDLIAIAGQREIIVIDAQLGFRYGTIKIKADSMVSTGEDGANLMRKRNSMYFSNDAEELNAVLFWGGNRYLVFPEVARQELPVVQGELIAKVSGGIKEFNQVVPQVDTKISVKTRETRPKNSNGPTRVAVGPSSITHKEISKHVAPLQKLHWPARGRVISTFGKRKDGMHNDGIGIAVPIGTDIHAADEGEVAYAGTLAGYGNLVLLRHYNGWVTAYAHNKTLLVTRGNKVERGQVIAKSGEPDGTNRPQIHFQVRQNTKPVDPLPHLEQR